MIRKARKVLLAMLLAAAGTVHAHPLPPRPAGHPGDWASDNDYPQAALRDHAEGIVGFVLTVGADGVPTQCEVSASSGNADLDTTTCSLMMQRARFNPATDANGRATSGTYANHVRWQMPDDGLWSLPPAGEVRLDYDVAADGTVSNCKLTATGELAKSLAKDEQAARCAQLGPFAPLTDNARKPVKRHMTTTQTNVVTEVP